MSRVLLVRHGQTAWHAEARYVGTADVPLDDVGLKQVADVVRHLHDVRIDGVYSSPLSRCSALAEAVAADHGLEVILDDRIREIDLGRWDGETYRDIFERDGEMLMQWTKDPDSSTIPGGESLFEVQKRSMEWFDDAMGRYPDGVILASSHGGPIRAIIAKIIGLPLSQLFRLQVDLASISIVNFKGKFSNLELMNERSHLSEIRTENFA